MNGVARSLVAALATPTAPPLPPGASHWDRLPVELRDEVDSHIASVPVWRILARMPLLEAESSSMTMEANTRLWTQALESDWQGDLATLPRIPWDHALTLRIASRGMLERVRACVPEFGDASKKAVEARDVAVCRLAIRRGWADLLEPLQPKALASAAALEGAMQVLEALRDAGLTVGDWLECVGLAVSGDHLETVKWLRLLLPNIKKLPRIFMLPAVSSGNLDLVVWLSKKTKRNKYLLESIPAAAENGHLHIVRWLADNARGQFLPFTFGKACENGHADILEFLYARYQGVYASTPDTFYILSRHASTLEWVKRHRPYLLSQKMFEWFVESGNVEAADWMVENTEHRVTWDLLVRALRGNSLEMVKWIIVVHGLEMDWRTFEFGHYIHNTDILAWLIRRDRSLARIMADDYALSGKYPLVKWLHVRFPGSVTQSTLMAAINSSCVRTVALLLQLNGVEWDLVAARHEAMWFGQNKIVKELRKPRVVPGARRGGVTGVWGDG